uniref:Orf75, hypothetical mitochondrial protein n=1 Tax=Ectocarpus siliculosus TaxID=2880 RepID=E6ZES2_ECTSI|nr:Putative orf75, mitochondrial hypothetical protein [Ectocarpus siliculosus]CBJ18014.1 Putative orf75, hypothetical mitochondrial protein [Ectocarpus siliculosus]
MKFESKPNNKNILGAILQSLIRFYTHFQYTLSLNTLKGLLSPFLLRMILLKKFILFYIRLADMEFFRFLIGIYFS